MKDPGHDVTVPRSRRPHPLHLQIAADATTYHILVRAHAADPRRLDQLLTDMRSRGITLNARIGSDLICAFADAQHLNSVRALWWDLRAEGLQLSLKAVQAVLQGYAEGPAGAAQADGGLQCLQDIEAALYAAPPDVVGLLVRAYAAQQSLEHVRQLHNELWLGVHSFSPEVACALAEAYIATGCREGLAELHHETARAAERGRADALLRVYSRDGRWELLLLLHEELVAVGRRMTDSAFGAVIAKCGAQGRLDVPHALAAQARPLRQPWEAATYAALVAAYGAGGRLRDVADVQAELEDAGCADAQVYSALVQAYGAANRLADAAQVYAKMQALGLRPRPAAQSIVQRLVARGGVLSASGGHERHLVPRGDGVDPDPGAEGGPTAGTSTACTGTHPAASQPLGVDAGVVPDAVPGGEGLRMGHREAVRGPVVEDVHAQPTTEGLVSAGVWGLPSGRSILHP